MERTIKEVTLEEFLSIDNTGVFNCEKYKIKVDGYICKAMVNGKNNDIKYSIWNETGGSVIYDWKNELDISIDKLRQLINWKKNGIKFCNRCLERIDGEYEILIAGTYCKKCWTPKDEELRDLFYSCLD